MTAAYRGPSEASTSLLAAAQSPGSLNPERGLSSSATSSTAKDAGTSSMPPPSVPSSALTKAGLAGSAASSQGSAAAQAPTAKGPPVRKVGGAAAVQEPPTKPASDSAIMAKSGAKELQSPPAIQGQFPTPAESVGRQVPKKKPPPTGNLKAKGSVKLIEP